MGMKRTCIQCGREFELSGSEISFYKKKKLSLPKRCKECREQNRKEKKKGAGQQPESVSGHKDEDSQPRQRTDDTHRRADTQAKQAGTPVDTEPGRGKQGPAGRGRKPVPKLLAAILVLAAMVYAVLSGQFGQQDAPQQTPQRNESQAVSGQQDAAVSYTFRSQKLLQEHFEKHGKEMGFANAKDYEKAASLVVTSKEALHKQEAEDGDDVYYLEKTNEFVIVSTDGYIRTYFEPEDGLDYYERQ